MISKKLKKILICPKCKNELSFKNEEAMCKKCSLAYSIKNNKIYFLKPNTKFKTEDWFDKIKSFFKKNKKFYNFLIYVISPVYSNLNFKIKKWLKRFDQQNIVVDIGSGANRFSKKITNIDVFDYKNVDIVADATKLPFKNNSIDGIINIAVLEHVKEPNKLIYEFYRVLKKGGRIFVFVPFLQGYHASPHDYYRWTQKGARELFKKFEKTKIIVAEGPTSSLLWTFQEWFAITFSFYNKYFYRILLLLIMALTFPIKYLDFFLSKHPSANQIAAGFYIVGKK